MSADSFHVRIEMGQRVKKEMCLILMISMKLFRNLGTQWPWNTEFYKYKNKSSSAAFLKNVAQAILGRGGGIGNPPTCSSMRHYWRKKLHCQQALSIHAAKSPQILEGLD